MKKQKQRKGAADMRKQNRIMKILKDKSGISMIFVLGIMLLLMAIGVSVLVAASANTGFMLNQKEHNQILILDDAVHKNIMYSLQHNTSDNNLLSRQLIEAIYSACDPEPESMVPISLGLLEDISLDIGFDEIGLEADNEKFEIKSITLSFPKTLNEMVIITLPVAAIYYPAEDTVSVDDEGNPYNIVKGAYGFTSRVPKTATVNAIMIVTVEIAVKDKNNSANDKIITSKATYEYTGGFFSDDPNGLHADNDTLGEEFKMELIPDNGKCGEWEMKKHEKVDR